MKTMRTGLLWRDDNGTLEDKVRCAARVYKHKHGVWPNVCYVNPSALLKSLTVSGVEVKPKHNVLLNHLWIGIEEEPNDV